MEIPVVFATDENYLFYTITAITSMAENAKSDTFYKIYILVSGQLKEGHPLLSGVQKKYSNIEICLLPVEEFRFQNVHIHNSHVSKAAFYRLLLGELLQVEKCLYLDSDIIVNTDLQELYTIELDSEYVGGVRDLWLDLTEEDEKERRRIKTGLPTMDQYVNSGVLLFHLDNIRKDNLVEKFCRHMQKDYIYEDQDIINVCCYGHIRRLSAKWNLFTLFMGRLDELEQRGIEWDTIWQMKEKKGIIHYATPYIRPWESERFLCNDIWWKYAAIWSETLEYQKLRERVRQREIGYSGEKMALYCRAYERIFIWGFTELGRKVYTELSGMGVDNIVSFIDNDAEKQKFTYCGKSVRPFEMDIYVPEKSAIIIVSQNKGKEVQEILADRGVLERDMVRYIMKDTVYYQCLRPEYNETEKGTGFN